VRGAGIALGPRDLIQGKLVYEGDLRVQGTLEGEATVSGDLSVEGQGTVRAKVEARNLAVRGSLDGEASVHERLLIAGQDADGKRVAADDGLVGLAGLVDRDQQEGRVDAYRGDRVGGHPRQQRSVARRHHCHPGREAAHHGSQPAALLIGHGRDRRRA